MKKQTKGNTILPKEKWALKYGMPQLKNTKYITNAPVSNNDNMPGNNHFFTGFYPFTLKTPPFVKNAQK